MRYYKLVDGQTFSVKETALKNPTRVFEKVKDFEDTGRVGKKVLAEQLKTAAMNSELVYIKFKKANEEQREMLCVPTLKEELGMVIVYDVEKEALRKVNLQTLSFVVYRNKKQYINK